MREEITGTKLGCYTLTKHLARGGMSDIYLACKEDSEQIYVLKLVEKEDEECYQRFQREVQKLSQLQHEHILCILDYGEQDGISYYVAPYIEHGTLKMALAAGPIGEKEAGDILAQVGDALQFMHDAGIVHRDIKSTNILLDENGWAWLADFGLAREVEAGSDLTATGCLIGTPSYMAPELAEEQASISSDIYALGVVLYEMLTGRPPFIGRTPLEICWKHTSAPPPLPSIFNAFISPAVESVVLHALEKDPRKRFATVREMVEAYQQALLYHDAPTDPGEIYFQDTGDIATAIRPFHSPALTQGKETQGRSLVAALVLVMLATLLALGSAGLAIELQGQSSMPVSSSAQRVELPSPTSTPTSTATSSPALAAGSRTVRQAPASPVPVQGGPSRHHRHGNKGG